jgi:hypothetical protein
MVARPPEDPITAAGSGIDVGVGPGVGPGARGTLSLFGFGFAAAKISNDQWDKITGREIGAALANREVPPFGPIAELSKLPVTYVFKTREGSPGVLQVVDSVRIIGGEESPPLGVKIRYKLLRPPAAAATVSQSGPPSFAPAVEEIVRDPEKAVAELLDLDTGRRATMKEFGRDDRETHAWIRQEKVDVMGAVEHGLPGILLFDCAVYENPSISWEKITPQEVVDHRGLNQTEPNPINPLATQDPSKLPLTCLFQTREGTKGVLQLVGLSDDKQGVKIRYKLLRHAADTERGGPRTETTEEGRRLRYFVRLVAGKDRVTFEGKETTWEKLPGLLKEVPHRAHTVLELAMASDEVTLKDKDLAVSHAEWAAGQFQFEYLSFIGMQPLGSKGSPAQTLPGPSQTEPAKQSH